MKRLFFSALALALAVPVPELAARQQASADAASLAPIRALDLRVQTIGHRLAVAGLAWCTNSDWRHGLVLIELSQVVPSLRPAVIRAFGRESGLGVMAVVPGSPAALAGLRADDVIAGLDGQAMPATAEARLTALAAAFSDGLAAFVVLRAGVPVNLVVQARRGCASVFLASARRGRNAYADGTIVEINAGLIDYAADDAELAAAMAHELAHNILGHRVELHGPRAAGQARRSTRETEIEADRLSVYLMERAGYDPQAAVRLWARLGPHPLNFLRTADHPGWRLRIQLFEAEIAKIRAARAAGRVPVPDFVTLPRPVS